MYETLQRQMIQQQLESRGIKSEAVLEAMRQVPRHLFVPEKLQKHAYDDSPLPIGHGQTISQPYIVAFMTEWLGLIPGMKVLEIGTGSGYQTAILAHMATDVYSIELLDEIYSGTRELITDLLYDNITLKCGNGYLGWPEEAPFDRIIVTAAPKRIPEILIEQLKDGGKMIVPVGPVHSVQYLKLIAIKDGEIFESNLLPVRFVPMIE
ncbi:MAG: protein-L-isoaspartate(D-aspartate) O-methyltransferase [Treponema sp.]|nr:protein-L-isoaspartate(D-aspartate) O-methyltransferase [Treponema sp.]